MSTFMARIHVSWVTFQYRISPLPSQEHRRSVFFGWKSNDVTWKLCPLKVCRENPGCKTIQHKQYCTTCKCKQKLKIQGKASNTDSTFYPLYWCIELGCSQQNIIWKIKKQKGKNICMPIHSWHGCTLLPLVPWGQYGLVVITLRDPLILKYLHLYQCTDYREQKHNCNVAVEGIIAVQHNIPKPYQGQVTYICSIPKFNSSIKR